MDRDKTLKVIIIILLLGLITYIYLGSKELSCDKCTITFQERGMLSVKLNMTELFNQAQLKECPVYWDRVQGYVKG